MASPTGTYTFAPGMGSLTLYAFNLAGVRPTALTQEHLQSAYMASNLLCATWSNWPNLWQIDLQTITLVAGTATYSVDPTTALILDAYAENSSGTQPIDRIILPISRSEYSSYTNKSQQGAITTYWFDRLLSPNVTFYLVPDGTTDTTVKYYRLIRLQDVALTGDQAPDVPYLFLEAFALGLAYRLADIWTPERADKLKLRADEAYKIAADTNIENAAIYVGPGMSQYWRV